MTSGKAIKLIISAVLITTAALFFSIEAHSKTIYVDGNTKNNRGKGTAESPYKYIQTGIRKMSSQGGDTLIIKSGRYTHPKDALIDFKSGGKKGYNIIKAEVDGEVIVDIPQAANVPSSFLIQNNKYLQLEGLKIISEGTDFMKAIDNSSYIKIFRTAFEGGPPNNNRVNFSVGNGSSYVLLEDVWFYGGGGRIKLIVYEAEKIVLRRVLIRHDHGWSNVLKAEPEGGGTIYNSKDVSVQNLIVIDSGKNSTNEGSPWAGAFTLANNGKNGAVCKNNDIRGSIVFDVEGNGFDHGGYFEITDISFEDILVWWTGDEPNRGGAIAHSNQSYKSTTAKRFLVGNQSYAGAVWGGKRSEITFKDSVIYKAVYAFGGNGPEQGSITSSGNTCILSRKCGINDSTRQNLPKGVIDSIYRPNTPSAMSNLPNLKYQIGKSGTLYGEPGFDEVQTIPLWPWPLEDRIKADLGSARNLPETSPAKRGFTASDLPLTDYLWQSVIEQVSVNQ